MFGQGISTVRFQQESLSALNRLAVRFQQESLSVLNRNPCPLSSGISVRFGQEQVSVLRKNMHLIHLLRVGREIFIILEISFFHTIASPLTIWINSLFTTIYLFRLSIALSILRLRGVIFFLTDISMVSIS